ncbi:hypothetical protein AAFF_G00107790 [Aldrovandia affinis]|uniref:Uncharacterized protein n=1 Tax=Aldrovandia affinis TaxID=143900 RepID=A0AAD7RUC5_9TELE|nr:hypothetical protein AAFF_G00107790 [Aldrovandia affinis]
MFAAGQPFLISVLFASRTKVLPAPLSGVLQLPEDLKFHPSPLPLSAMATASTVFSSVVRSWLTPGSGPLAWGISVEPWLAVSELCPANCAASRATVLSGPRSEVTSLQRAVFGLCTALQ